MNVRIYEIDPDAGPLQSQIVAAPGAVKVQQQDVARVEDGQWAALRATRDGAPIVVPWVMALVLEGVCFNLTVGAFATSIVGGGAGTIIDLDQPEFTIAIPANSVLLPLRVSIQIEMIFMDADNEVTDILVAADRTQAIIDGTATPETVLNMRTDRSTPSVVTARSAYTGNSTAPVLGLELARTQITGNQSVAAAHQFYYSTGLLYEPAAPPVLVGPATLLGYFGGSTTVEGYAQAVWAELPVGAII